MGGGSSTAATPRAIHIKVETSEKKSHSKEINKGNNAKGNDAKNHDGTDGADTDAVVNRQMSVIQEEGGDDNSLHPGNLSRPISKTPVVNDRSMRSRCESVQDGRSTREMMLQSVTPSAEPSGYRDATIDRVMLTGIPRSPVSEKGEIHAEPEEEIPQIEENKMNKLTVLFEKPWSGNAPGEDFPCWVHGMATLAEGQVLILDLNNNKLKLFDENFKFCCDVSVSEESQGISSVYSQEVAVTCGTEIRFYFVNKEKFILQQRCFKLNGQGFGISFNRNNYAVTCDIHKGGGSVRILSEKGKQRYVIKSCKIFGSLLKMSKYIQIDSASDIVYISDLENGRILAISFEGQAMWEVKVGDEPRGILFINDYLVVTDYRQHQVLQLSTDGTEIEVILTGDDDIWSPEYVMFNKKSSLLMVTSPESILIFKLL